MSAKKATFASGTVWEDMAGYSRAVRVGDRILVSGTTATGPEGLVGGSDPAAQARFILDKIEFSIKALGGRLEDVVRTRVYVSDIAHWEPVARVHGERFGRIRPANTLVEARLVGSEYLVEMEAEAVLGAGGL
jgi:enamine deaminase RidA (YjgF/YER057c/UK114 family)